MLPPTLGAHEHDLTPFLHQPSFDKVMDQKYRPDSTGGVHLDLVCPFWFVEGLGAEVSCCDDHSIWRAFCSLEMRDESGSGRLGGNVYARNV